MMYIGTSFGRCLKSILLNEVSIDDVLLIITKTKAETLEKLYDVTEKYYYFGNNYMSDTNNYDFNDVSLSLEKIKDVVKTLYISGKIHQPRLFGYSDFNFYNEEHDTEPLWLEINPIGLNKNPIVIEAYQKYKMWDKLTK